METTPKFMLRESTWSWDLVQYYIDVVILSQIIINLISLLK